MDWDNYRAFLEVYRSGDLVHASLALDMSVPTVRRRLDAVESQIGFPLFERTPRGLSPTPVARRLVRTIAAMGDFAALADALKSGSADYVVLCIDDWLQHYASSGLLADLRRCFPGMAVAVLGRPGLADPPEVKADLSISLSPPDSPRPLTRSVGTLEVGLFAHPHYLARAGHPENADDLGRFCIVAPESDEDGRWLEARLGLPVGVSRSAFRADRYEAQVAAVQAGVGIGVCFVDRVGRGSGLTRVVPEIGARLECWVWSSRDASNGIAAAVFETTAQAMSERLASLDPMANDGAGHRRPAHIAA